MRYTVQEVSSLSSASVRTLRYYDQIDLLKPAYYGNNGYRYYEEEQLIRLQHILFFRELGLPLADIRQIVEQPSFDQAEALQQHRQLLSAQVERLERLIHTIDRTITNLENSHPVEAHQLFDGFDAKQQNNCLRELRDSYGIHQLQPPLITI